MELLSRKADLQIFDRIRKKWVKRTPEEEIRQQVITWMIEDLNYPESLIAVEKELVTLAAHYATPYSLGKQIPKRRLDIIVFSEKKLRPLLLIECKAVPLTPQFSRQVIGYNTFVGANFISLANHQGILTGHLDKTQGDYHFEQGLPNYFNIRQSILHLVNE